MTVLDRAGLEQSQLSDLHAIASELGIEGYRKLRREALIDRILASRGAEGEAAEEGDDEAPRPSRARPRRSRRSPDREREATSDGDDAAPAVAEEEAAPAAADEDGAEEEVADAGHEVRAGMLDILPNGSGFMRAKAFAHSRDDVYVSPAQIRRCELRPGDVIEGPVRPPRRSERHPSLVRIDQVNGAAAEPPPERADFGALTPVFASKRLPAPPELDAAPLGRGSRVAIAGPPGAGATRLLRALVKGLVDVDSDLRPVVILVGARPEEVVEWRREQALIVAGGSFDEPIDEQAHAAELAIERVKRAVERGEDAVVVVDSLDALPPASARRVFGAGRAVEEGGSLTVIAATGSAGEPLRQATTRIVLEPGADGARLAPASGTLRADLLE